MQPRWEDTSALLEAMGYGNCVLTLATPENIEAVADAGIPYADEFGSS